MSSNVAMQDGSAAPALSPRWMVWTGRVLSALCILLMLWSAGMKLSNQPEVLEMIGGKFGFPVTMVTGIGVLELACILLYAVPQTAPLGAVLLTAYLGGATVTHLRVNDPFVGPILIGVAVWAGLFLRNGRVRALFWPRR
jgi:hypothetical protein